MGKVKKYIINKLEEYGSLHFTLIDPEDIELEEIPKLVKIINKSDSDAIMVGGSTVTDQIFLSEVVMSIKSHTNLPVILFPNNISGITKHADAIWFMSLLNSSNPYYIIGAQMLAAPYIKRIGLETLSMGYIIVGEGRSAGFIGQATPIPYDKPELALAFSLAAEFLGMDFVYLEAGSGAKKPVPPKFIKLIKSKCNRIKLVVGGGIRSYKDAFSLASSGADIIVTGTVIEETPEKLYEIVQGVKDGGISKIKIE